MEPAPETETWAVCELMGHVKLAGRLTETERFGGKLARLDVPDEAGGYVTKIFAAASVYCITFVSEKVARTVAKVSSNVAPVQPWDFPRALVDGSVHAPPDRIEADMQSNEDDAETDDWGFDPVGAGGPGRAL